MYAGITNNWLNPALLASSPFRWDFNVAMVHVNVDNNYLYLYQANLYSLKVDNGATPIIIDNDWDLTHDKFSKFMVENRDNNNWKKSVYASVIAEGPSLMFNIKKWTFTLEDAVRVEASADGIHKTIAKFLYEGITAKDFQDIFITIPKFRANAMAWSEAGFSVAREIKINKGICIKGGITLKRLIGYAGVYAILNKNAQIQPSRDSNIYFENVDAKYGYAFMDTKNINKDNFDSPQGYGKSMDLGITIEKKTLQNKYQCPNFCNKKLQLQYSWKLGFSLLDIGYINFNRDAKSFLIDDKSCEWFKISSTKANDVNAIDSLISEHFNKNPFPTTVSTKFTMALPWAASVQYDYNIGYNVYVNATWVQRIPHFGMPGVDRTNSIAITPRFDSENFGFAVPFVFDQYVLPRIGVAIRLDNSVIIGTDKLGAFIGNRLSGVDIYFALKFNVLKKCRKKKTMPSFLPDLNFMKQYKKN